MRTMIPKELLAALRDDRDPHGAARQRAAVGDVHVELQGPGARVPRGAPVPAGRRRPHDRLERLGAHERDLREGLRRRARDDGDARRRPLGERALRHAARRRRRASRARSRALLAFSAIRNNDRVGLILATDQVERIVPPKKGEKHVMRVVREILGFEPEAARGRGRGHARDEQAAEPLLGAGDEPQGGARGARRRRAAPEHRVRRERLLRPGLRARAGARRGEARRRPGGARRPARRASCPTSGSRPSRTSRAARASSSTPATRASARSTRTR